MSDRQFRAFVVVCNPLRGRVYTDGFHRRCIDAEKVQTFHSFVIDENEKLWLVYSIIPRCVQAVGIRTMMRLLLPSERPHLIGRDSVTNGTTSSVGGSVYFFLSFESPKQLITVGILL